MRCRLGGYGGGIYNLSSMSLTSSTVSDNHTGEGMAGGYGGGIGGSGSLRNSIIAGNTVAAFGSGSDLTGTFNSQDYNLIGSGGTLAGTTTHNIMGQNPLLGSLANNGGPTHTMLPLPGSPAINKGMDVTTHNAAVAGSVAMVTITDTTHITAVIEVVIP